MKKKVLHVLNCNNFGGAERVVLSLIKLMSADYEMAFAAPMGPFEDVLKKENIQFIPMKSCSPKNIRRVVKSWNPDMIHAHDFRASVFSAFSFTGVPVVSHLHTSNRWMRKFSVNSLVYVTALPKLKKIISVSNALVREMSFSRFMKNKLRVIPNIIDVEQIILKANSCNNNQEHDVAFIGRLSPEKDPLKFIRIVSKLQKLNSQINAVMVGDGPLMRTCEELVKELKLENNITLVGYQTNPYPYLKNTKMLLVTSSYEAYPLVVLESFALGKPVLATPVGGLVDNIDQSCGFLCSTDEEFVEKIIHLLNDIAFHHYLSDGAIKRSGIINNKDLYIREIKEIYSEAG